MQRVAALYLPMWPIERLWRAERRAGPPEPPRAPASLDPLREAVAEEQKHACSVPRGGGWRPGARWARERDLGQAALPLAPRVPARHEVGRKDEAAGHPFRAMPPDEGAPASAWRPPAVPRTGGAPMVTAIRVDNRQAIAAACPHALAIGLRPGMPLAQARAQVAGLDIRPADPVGDGESLRRLAVALARRWCPVVTRDGDDGLLLDITGTAHLHGGEKAMARRIVRRLARRGFTARIAIADTAGAAHALARHTRGGICPPGRHRTAITPLPVCGLRVEDKAVELLKRLGIETIGQLAAMPRAPLAKRFGLALVRRIDQALGDAPEPIDPLVPAEPIAVQRRFAEPIGTADGIAACLGALVPGLAVALEAEGLGARALELVADRVDGVPQRIRIGLARPNRDPVHLLRLLCRRIEDIEPGFGIDALTLYVRRAEPLGPEPVFERTDTEATPDVATLVDTLATRIGEAAMWRQRPVESDVPERSAARMGVMDVEPLPANRLKPGDVRQLRRIQALKPWHPDWPRPVRLLSNPERLDRVIAEMPDHAPKRFTWRGQTHRVIRADGPERVLGEWWRHASELHGVRDYFQVEDECGCRYWLFRKGDGARPVTGDLSWYLHGVFG